MSKTLDDDIFKEMYNFKRIGIYEIRRLLDSLYVSLHRSPRTTLTLLLKLEVRGSNTLEVLRIG